MDLVPYMYWERQEPGSQLCAQHCLNNLLQQFTYSEFDLAEIAQKLDQAENAALSSANQNKKSYNLDDTGFFSISVLERALQVWDLTLVRWRGEAMKPYQEHPEDQAGFILHLAQHWLPLRRFSPHPPHNSASKRWYNLNSFLPNGPEWISPTYLRLVLTQAEQEGYSVFVIRRAGKSTTEKEGSGWKDGGIGVLPECEADRLAVVLGEPVGRGGGPSTATNVGAGPSDKPTVDPGPSSSSPGPSRRRRHQEELTTDTTDELAPPPVSRGSRRTDPTQPFGEEDDSDEEEFHPALTDFAKHSRDYDDEDAALQAALKASMEDVPAGWKAPDLKPKAPAKAVPKAAPPVQSTPPVPAPVSTMPEVPKAPPSIFAPGGGIGASGSRFKEVEEDEETEILSPDEIRRRRLAKFGQ